MENYSAMKLELLALKWAVTVKFREYLLGRKFTIFTDNNPLSHLRTAKLGAIEQRWASDLARFDFDIQYRPGKQNGNADALSRQARVPERILAPSPEQVAEETPEAQSAPGSGLPLFLVLIPDRPGSGLPPFLVLIPDRPGSGDRKSTRLNSSH